MSNGNGQIPEQPLALARPALMIEVALPDGNKVLAIEVARQLHTQLGLALASLDNAAEQASELGDVGNDDDSVIETP